MNAQIKPSLKCGHRTRQVVKLEIVQNVFQLLKKMEVVLTWFVILVIIDFVGLVVLLQMDGFINCK